jgi:hypothetical protein
MVKIVKKKFTLQNRELKSILQRVVVRAAPVTLEFDSNVVSLFSIEPIDIHHHCRTTPLDLLPQAHYQSY